MIKLICDLNGGDLSSLDLSMRICEFIEEHTDVSLLVIGDIDLNHERIEVIKTTDTISNTDDLMISIIEKKNASINIAFDKLKEYDGLVTVGATGALIVKSMMTLKRFSSSRPPLASLLPVKDKQLCLLDCGANTECSAQNLLEFAKLGSAYIKAFMANPSPKVGLISNGTEKTKGSAIVKEAYELLEASNLDFVGNVEGTSLLSGDIDVAVADGYVGNICLKTIEGTAKTVLKQTYKLNAPKEIMQELLTYYDFNNLGAALLLGVDRVVLKAHGAATPDTIYHVLNQAYKLVKRNLIDIIRKEFE